MTSKASPASATNAIDLLIDDHKKVKKLFKEFEKAKDQPNSEKAELVNQICTELIAHTEIEETIFYPAVREALKDEDMIDEAIVEHATAKELITQLLSMNPKDDLYDAKVTVLGEYIDHHVEEEEKEMFAKAKKAKLDLLTLGEEMASEKDRILSEHESKSDSRPAKKTAAHKKATQHA